MNYSRTGVDISNNVPGHLDELSRRLVRRLTQAVETAGHIIAQRAYELANVSPGVRGHAADGGHMRDHIEVHVLTTPTTIEARVGVDKNMVPYVDHQEFGPHGKPFLRPATDESRPEIHEMLQEVTSDTQAEDASSFVRFVRGRRS